MPFAGFVKNTPHLFFLTLFFIIAFASPAFAQEAPSLLQSYSAIFTLVEDSALVEERFIFTSSQQDFSWYLPEDAEAVEVFEGLMVVEKREEGKKIKVTGNFET